MCFEVLNESGTYAPKSGSGSEDGYQLPLDEAWVE